MIHILTVWFIKYWIAALFASFIVVIYGSIKMRYFPDPKDENLPS